MMRRSVAIRLGEVASYSLGCLLLGFFAVQLAQGEIQRRDAVSAFAQQMPAVEAEGLVPAPVAPVFDQAEAPDMTLWSPERIADYQASLAQHLPPVLGVLEVPSVKLKVPVYQTNSELVMDRAAGVIDGMAYPHEPGNIGISGHRDGYFRSLKDVQVGDAILLQTLEGEKRFVIGATDIVDIDDTRLLQDTRDQTVTLVTCYPFYFVGPAPQRFIVTATLDEHYVNQN